MDLMNNVRAGLRDRAHNTRRCGCCLSARSVFSALNTPTDRSN